MQIRHIIIALAAIGAAAGLYLATANHSSKQETAADSPYMPEAREPVLPVQCPSTEGSEIPTFSGEHTEATRAAILAHERTIYNGKFIEPEHERLIHYTDLNKDGREDFITLYTGMNWCGSIGCLVEMFVQQEDGSYTASQGMYSTQEKLIILGHIENDFVQMLSPVQDDSIPGANHLWSWNGESYTSELTCY